MKKLLYLTNNFSFYDEIGAGPASRHLFHVERLVKAGYQVEVIAPYIDNLSRKVPEKYSNQKYILEKYPGLNIYRTYAFSNFKGNLFHRLLNALSFAYYAFWGGIRIKDLDIIFATSPTIFVATIGWALSRIKRIPFVLEIRDLWTESIKSSGYLGSKILGRIFKSIENKLYKDADRLIAVTPGIKAALCRELRNGYNKVSLIPNGIDVSLLAETEKQSNIPTPGLTKGHGEFICMFAGKHARYNGLENILAAAELLQMEKDIRFVLIGDGYQKPLLLDMVKQKKLSNVSFLDAVPKRQIFSYLQAADLFLLPYSNNNLWRVALPNKLFDYMAVGRPIIAVLPPGDTSAVLSQAHCGVTVPPENPQILAEVIKIFAADRQTIEPIGQRGKEYVVHHFSRSDIADKFVGLLESLSNN